MSLGLETQGIGWCQSLIEQSLSWPAVKELLQIKYPTILNQFASLENVGEIKDSDIRLARKAGGFAFEYWCSGGDLKDIDSLLEQFNSMLGDKYMEGETYQDATARQFVMDKIRRNAGLEIQSQNFSTNDVWNLDLIQRQSLLRSWKQEMDPQTMLDKTAEIHQRHQAAIARRNKLFDGVNARCLEQQDVIGTTITACARDWDILNQVGIETVICEEAGEVKEAEFLCTLFPSVAHSISIGDPLQLRPQVNEPALSIETHTGASYRLDESLMERMMMPSTSELTPIASSHLNVQRRMHPEIANIMRATLYPYLEDHEATKYREPVPVMADRVWWLDHEMPEEKPDPRSPSGTSFSNMFEMEMVAGLVEHLVHSNEYDFNDITILTPYNEQLAAFTNRFKGMCSLWLSDKDREFLFDQGLMDPDASSAGSKADIRISNVLKLATIDNFQGEESRVIILSTVRSNLEGRVGFMKTSNRINVGCSRARNGFYIVGNASVMSNVEMWNQIVNNVTANGKIGPAFRICCPRHQSEISLIQFPEQWRSIPECQVPCNAILTCGHHCDMKCHAPSLHERIRCDKPCRKIHEKCGHLCIKTCGEECGECNYPLEKVTLPCGHEVTQTCSESQSQQATICNALLESVQLPCGHWAERHCSTADQILKCKEKCKQTLSCGHKCMGACQDCTNNKRHLKCVAACSKILPCGHQCIAPCHKEACPPCQLSCSVSCRHGGCTQGCGRICDPCMQPCEWACPHSGPCTTMCCLPCDELPCNEPCKRLLQCGHLCPSLCGELCGTRCSQCATGQFHGRIQMFLHCGHNFDLEVLDKHVELSSFYDLDNTGKILKTNLSTRQAPASAKPFCPACGRDFTNIQRYALIVKLTSLNGTFDRIYANFSQRLGVFMEQVYSIRTQYDQDYNIFQKTLKPSPLSGKTNEDAVNDRRMVLARLENSVENSKGIAHIYACIYGS